MTGEVALTPGLSKLENLTRGTLAAVEARISVKLLVMCLAIREPFVFVEPLPSEGALAVRAHEMFRVPLLIYSGYRASFYRLLARCTYADFL